MKNFLLLLFIAMLAGCCTQAVLPKDDEEATADKRTLIAEPIIERGPQASVLGGLKPDEKILKLIETYHKTGNNWSEEEREKKEEEKQEKK